MQMSCEGREADLTGGECAKNGELLVRYGTPTRAPLFISRAQRRCGTGDKGLSDGMRYGLFANY